jgi:hypothetical protein
MVSADSLTNISLVVQIVTKKLKSHVYIEIGIIWQGLERKRMRFDLRSPTIKLS